MTDDLCRRPATELARLLRARGIGALELLELHIDRMERLDPILNAIPTRTFEQAREDARAADDALARGDPVGPLHGLPIAFKDLLATAGVRTTMGSPLLAEWIPDVDSLTVTALRDAGAVCLGKTNVPEFGAGSQTYNAVFGPTRNPYDPTRTPGGSSGGAAAALAAGMIAIADGSDYGGSLRNPASFCNVVGFRPTLGLVPAEPSTRRAAGLSTDGPLGRTVADVALVLGALLGRSIDADPLGDDALRRLRVAVAPSFAGLPFDPLVRRAFAGVPPILEAMGCAVQEAEPPMDGADTAFLAPRHASFGDQVREVTADDEERLALVKPELRWHVEESRRIGPADLDTANRARDRIVADFGRFMDKYDVLALPVSQVPPFPIEQHWPTVVDGVPMADYLDWMRSSWYVSLFGAPAMSVPAAFVEGLPFGAQLVGRPGRDEDLLRFAVAFELASGEVWLRAPVVATPV
jgi:amidase